MNNTSNELERIGAVLKENRTQCGLSIDAICEKTGIIPSRLVDFEDGEALPSLEQLQKLASVFHTTITTLFLETDATYLAPKSDTKQKPKIQTCRSAARPLHNRQKDHSPKCSNPERTRIHPDRKITKKDCENCPYYHSKYIEYPITVDKLDITSIEAWDLRKIGELVTVQPYVNNPEKKTYLGLYLGEQPWTMTTTYHRKSRHLRIRSVCNPMIYIFDTKTIVRGADSWWEHIEADVINDTWYTEMIKKQIENETNHNSK